MKPLIVANWKMNPATLKEAKELFDSVAEGIKDVKNVEVVICPPFLYIPAIRKGEYEIRIGGQDCFWEEIGAFTGEVSATMLKDLGCEYVILGHSERRRYLNETDGMVNKKLKAAIITGLKPILCVGSKEKGERGNQEMKLQLEKALDGIEKSGLDKIIFTYEPIWAISTGQGCVAATPENTKVGSNFIREILTELFGGNIAHKARIIYGGSVDNNNIEGFIKTAEMEGALVGTASLRPDDFIAMVKKVDFLSKN